MPKAQVQESAHAKPQVATGSFCEALQCSPEYHIIFITSKRGRKDFYVLRLFGSIAVWE